MRSKQKASFARVTLQVMKHVFTGELAQRLPGILRLLQELTRQQSGLEFLYTVLRYVSQTGRNVTAEDIRQAVVIVFPVEGAVLMATAAEQWLEQGKVLGKQEGMVLGKQEGKQEGLMVAIELGLELKFGAAGLALLPMIRHVQNTEVLRTLAESIKTTQTLTELRTRYATLATPAA